MKLAVSTYSLSRWRRENQRILKQVMEHIALDGAAAVEFAEATDPYDPEPTAAQAVALRQQCDQLGLNVAGYCVGAELLCPPTDQRRVIEGLKRHIDVAADLGSPSMRHDITRGPDPRHRPIDDDDAFASALKAVVPAIREIADYGQSKGVRTSLENHGFFIQSPDRVEQVLEAVDHPQFALTLDTGNFLCVNENPVEAVRRLAKYAVLVHVKDFHVKLKERMPAALDSGWFATPTEIALRGAIVGHGQIDIAAQLRILRDTGYTGYLSLEFEGIEHPGLAIRLGLSYLRDQLDVIENES